MAKNTSVILGEYFQSFIEQTVQAGRYGSTSEVIRAGLRLLEVQEAKREEIRASLIKGENSGVVKDFDPRATLATFHKNHGK